MADFHKIIRKDGKKYKVVYLGRLDLDRICDAIKYLQRHRPEYYQWLRDPGTNRLIKEFQAEVPLEFEVARK